MAARTASANGNHVLNLCFHGIGKPTRELEPDEELCWVEEAQFAELLGVIKRFPSLRITFDDGNASDAAIALPLLVKHKLTATFFIVADRIGEAGSLGAADVRSLTTAGMRIGSHGKAHRPWRSVAGDELHAELRGAADVIAAVSGQAVREVALPFGSYDRRVLNALRRCPFERVYTVDGGPARRDAWLQSRYTVLFNDTPSDIEHRASFPSGGTVQSVIRTGKSLVKRWR
jgi:peptidoglycan/xylan/chitin deacetylase (PgdA/CDA1 family)